MKKIILPFLLLTLLAGSAQAQPNRGGRPAGGNAPGEKAALTSLPIGSPIPNGGFMLIGVDGKPLNLNQAKTEKGLLVMFSCNTCPFVIKAQGQTRGAMQIAKKLGIGMVIINSNQALRDSLDSRPAMKEYATNNGYDVPYLADEMCRMADAFGATRTPEVFLFDGDGKLVYKGALEDNPANPEKSTKFYTMDAMKALSGKKAINPAETKSIGCSIKRLES